MGKCGGDMADRKRKTLITIFVSFGVICAAAAIGIRMALPHNFAESPLNPAALEEIRQGPDSSTGDPLETAFRYLEHGIAEENRPVRTELRLSIRKIAPQQLLISIMDPSPSNERAMTTMDRLYVEQGEDLRWTILKHERAWRGQKKFSWTAEPLE